MLDKDELEGYRREFPIVKSSIYLDHAGVAPVPLRVKNEIERFLSQASEMAILDYDSWMGRVEEVRAASSKLIGSDVQEVCFVKNTSHGISLVSSGLEWRKGDNVIITDKDFPSNVYPWLDLKRRGVHLRVAPFTDGQIRVEDIENLIDSETRLISVSSVQSVNGFLIDLKRLGELCRERGVLFFVDAIQSLGVLPMDVKECGVDFLAADGHKWLLSPEGAGIFYCRKDLVEKLHPCLIGWQSVEGSDDFESINLKLKTWAGRFEEGSYNVMGIHALGASLEMITEIGVANIMKRVRGLGDLIIEEADKRGFEIKSPRSAHMRGGIVSFAGDFDPVTVREELMASHIVVNQRLGALRLAPHFYNTEDEIIKFFNGLDKILSGD